MDESEPLLQAQPFQDAAAEVASHPFLVEAARGSLTPAAWTHYIQARMTIADPFVRYLTAVMGFAKREGLTRLASAVYSNLTEEMGFHTGKIHPLRSHETWRTQFRTEMFALLCSKGMSIEDLCSDAPTIQGEDPYTSAWQTLIKAEDAYMLSGALTGLELMIGREYVQVLQGITKQFPGEVSEQGLLYLRSHAHHDDRHFRDLFQPLQEACRTHDDIDRVLSGITVMKQGKIGFLDIVTGRPPVVAKSL